MEAQNIYVENSTSPNPSKLEISFLTAWEKYCSEQEGQFRAARKKLALGFAAIQSELPECTILLVKRVRQLGLDMPLIFDAEDAKALWEDLKVDPRFQTYRTCQQIIRDHALLPEQWDGLAAIAEEIFDTEGEKRSKKYRMRS